MKANPRFRRRSASLAGGFFLPGDAVDPAYRNIRDKTIGPAPEARAFIDSLCLRYRGLEDHNFLTDAKKHFLQRFWEMYLAVTFLERGLTPSRRKGRGGGPEFWFSLGLATENARSGSKLSHLALGTVQTGLRNRRLGSSPTCRQRRFSSASPTP